MDTLLHIFINTFLYYGRKQNLETNLRMRLCYFCRSELLGYGRVFTPIVAQLAYIYVLGGNNRFLCDCLNWNKTDC